jgi:hypothetical protein
MSITKYKPNSSRKPFIPNLKGTFNSDEGVFKTADFVLSAFLLCFGVELLRAEQYPDDLNPNRKNFVFKNEGGLEELLNTFISEDPKVNIKKFIWSQRELKRIIHGDEQTEN